MFPLFFFSAALPSLAHGREEKALESGCLGSRLTSAPYWLRDHAQNFLSVPQFPRLKNGRSNPSGYRKCCHDELSLTRWLK